MNLPSTNKLPARIPVLSPTEQKSIERLNFVRSHPEMNEYVGIVMSTVASCENSHLTLPHIPLEESHRHIFGSRGRGGCSRCQRTFQAKKDALARIHFDRN